MSSRAILGGLLALSLAATAWLALQPQGSVELVAAAPSRPSPPEGDHRPPVAAPGITQPRADWPEPSAAALSAWAPPKAPETAPVPSTAPPERPRPPAFPYQWIGNLDDGGGVQALLTGSHRSFGARAGDLIDGRWRIEQVAGRSLQLTWVPTGERIDVAAR